MHRLQGRIIGVCTIGWWLSAGVVWSAEVYELSAIVAALLVTLPWALAGGAFALMSSVPDGGQVDVMKLALQGGLRSEHFDCGDFVVRQGEAAEHFYMITRGRAVVLVDDDEYSQTEVGELLVGQFFGETGLLTGGSRSATVRASEPLDVLVMDKAAFSGLIDGDAALSARIRRISVQRIGP